MTANATFERSVAEWLRADAPAQPPADILAGALDRVENLGQDRYLAQRLLGNRLGRSETLRFASMIAITMLTVAALIASATIIGNRPTAPVPPVPPPATANPTPANTPSRNPVDRSKAGAFVPGPELRIGRGMHTATRLSDGRVLIVGGQIHPDAMVPVADSTEIWDPLDDGSDFVRGDALGEGRAQHTATLLPDGRVLVVGGQWFDVASGQIVRSSAEVWEPQTEQFRPAGSMAQERFGHSATLLPDGRVLIAGGSTFSEQLASMEIWDPATSSFSAAGALMKPRVNHSSFLLPDGRVMFVGLEDTEFWDPATGLSEEGPSLVEARYFHSATLLSDGGVLVVGGLWGDNDAMASRLTAEMWDPDTNSFELVDPPEGPRAGHQATLLEDGRVLIDGGADVPSFELWDPLTGEWSPVGPMTEDRSGGGATATLLADGRVLVVGDMSRQGITTMTEIWDGAAAPQPMPPPPTPGPTGSPGPVPGGG